LAKENQRTGEVVDDSETLIGMIENKGELDDSKSELISTADTQCIGMTAFCL
jgi:hypothetical protein